MKKILFVATVASHINSFHILYLKMFKEKGYEVHVASKGNETIEYCDKHFEIPFERFPLKLQNIKAYKQLKNIINENKYEMIHCHTPVGGVLTRLAARRTRKKYNTKVIYTAHGFHFYNGAPILNWIIYYPIEKICARWTDCLITITNEDYEFAKKHLNAKKVEHINGVGMNSERLEKTLSEEEKNKVREKLKIKKEDIIFSYVAELNKNKNQILLIKAIQELKKELPNIKLFLIGDGPLKGEYQQYIENNNLENEIKLLGKRKDINELLSITNIYLASSIREGLPVNVMEAMYKGLPIIATDNRGHRELVQNNENGFIITNNRSTEELINTIKQVIKDTEKLTKCSINNKLKIGKFELNNVLKDMQKIYTNITKKKVIHILNTNKYSGAENVAITIINNVNKNEKFKCLYMSPEGEISKVLKKNGIEYIPVKKLSCREIRRICKKYNPDIIHAHDFRASIKCALLKKNNLLIFHIHNNPPWIKRININSFSFLLAGLKADKILTVSKAIGKEYIFFNFIRNKTRCIGNPLERKKILKQVKGIDSEKKYDICCTARISKQKNPMEFLNIIYQVKSIIPEIKAIWIGDGEMKNDMKQKIKELGMENNVKLLGFKNNPYEYMKKSKIFLLTSDWEGFGLSAFEALTLGLPCVVNNVGGLREIVTNDCGKLFVNSQEAVENIIKMLKDTKLLENKSQKAKNRAKHLENINDYIEKIIKLYET